MKRRFQTGSLRVAQPSRLRSLSRNAAGFTVVELLVAVTIMTVIVLALYGMFSQTQKALTGNIAQMDILEAGRAAMEIVSEEVQQVNTPAIAGYENLFVEGSRNTAPWQMPLVMTNSFRTNVLQDLFVLRENAGRWQAVGYFLRETNGVAALYRWQASTGRVLNGSPDIRPIELSRTQLSVNQNRGAENFAVRFRDALRLSIDRLTNEVVRVAEGVVHFRVLAYDADGRVMTVPSIERFYPRGTFHSFNEFGMAADGLWIGATNRIGVVTNHTVIVRRTDAGQAEVRYLNEGLPAYLDVELGILDPTAYDRFKALSVNRSSATNYLAGQAGHVHLFHQRIPIRVAPR